QFFPGWSGSSGFVGRWKEYSSCKTKSLVSTMYCSMISGRRIIGLVIVVSDMLMTVATFQSFAAAPHAARASRHHAPTILFTAAPLGEYTQFVQRGTPPGRRCFARRK